MDKRPFETLPRHRQHQILRTRQARGAATWVYERSQGRRSY